MSCQNNNCGCNNNTNNCGCNSCYQTEPMNCPKNCCNDNCCDNQDGLGCITKCEFIWLSGKDDCGNEHTIKLSLRGLKQALEDIDLDAAG